MQVRITELESKVRQLQAEKDALDDELLVQKHRSNELNKVGKVVVHVNATLLVNFIISNSS